MRPFRVHVIYEHSADRRPFSSSHIRLLRPLTHPSLTHWISTSSGPEICDEPVDVVVLDRLWRQDVSAELAQSLVEDIRRRRARLIYSLDDDLMALLMQAPAANSDRLAALRVFLAAADRVIVSTRPLYHALCSFAERITVIPNYLDERLLPSHLLGTAEEYEHRLARRQGQAPLIVGFMGTRTHDEDIRLAAPALRAVYRRHPGRIRVELVGVIARKETWAFFDGLPVRKLDPGSDYTEYPSFLPWFAATCRWDIALAPLADTTFNACKSDVKFLDYAVLGAAGIYSRVPAYERTVQHGVTGYLVDNTREAWESSLERLVEHPIEALSVGWAAQRYLREYRTLARGSNLWLNAIRLTLTQGE